MKDYWSSGSITALNLDNKTGVIQSFDGKNVIFHISQLIKSDEGNSLLPAVGKSAVFHVIETDAGLQAQEITLLNVKSK